ncbi:MAG: hypothetical protein L7U48_05665 [Candidatus Poseidoniaceae archaeon]|nr:hypothetical protein [Candidatus Poseidoniaceae archaeon]
MNGMTNTDQVFAEERTLHAGPRAVHSTSLTSRPTPVQTTGVRADRGNSGFPV